MIETIVDIVLIEDNPADIELTVRALKKFQIANQIKILKDGEEAINYFFPENTDANSQKHLQPRLVLLDLKLPKVNGLEILKRLKSDPRTKMLPVVVLTSSREESDVIKSYQLGVNSYLVKPVDFDEFLESVRNLGLYWLLLNEQPEY